MEQPIFAEIMVFGRNGMACAIIRGEHISITDNGFIHVSNVGHLTHATIEIESFEYNGYAGRYEARLKI